MRADFVNEVAKILDIKRKDMIEKDMVRHELNEITAGPSQVAWSSLRSNHRTIMFTDIFSSFGDSTQPMTISPGKIRAIKK